MRRSFLVRLSAVAIAAGSLASLPLTPAAAAAAASCGKLVSNPPKGTTSTSTISSCTPLAATGGKGTSVTNLKTLVSKTTWANGKGTTTVKVKYAAGKTQGKCPANTTHIVSTGKVTASTGAAAKVIKVGQASNASVCVNKKTSAASLEPGTRYTF